MPSSSQDCSGRNGQGQGPAVTLMKIDHIGVATKGIAESMSVFCDALGFDIEDTEEVSGQKVRVAMLPIGDSRIELLEATSPDSPISKFLERRGPGLHHIAFGVADIRAALADLKAKGARLIDEEPRPGSGGCLVAFIHPSSTNGVLIELVERPDDHQGYRIFERKTYFEFQKQSTDRGRNRSRICTRPNRLAGESRPSSSH